MSDAVVAEVVPGTAIAVRPDDLESLVKENDRGVYKAMAGMDTLDWKNLKPNHAAVLLMQKPYPVAGGGTMYLNIKQALFLAVRAFELGVSPFSGAVWFDPAKFTVNLTLEGKREVARNRGIDLGPPSFQLIERKWEDLPKDTTTAQDAQKAGYRKDIGAKCKIRVGDPKNQEFSEYTAWLSEWFQSRSPVWKEKPEHMLQTRAMEKAITLALGTGASSMPDERDLS